MAKKKASKKKKKKAKAKALASKKQYYHNWYVWNQTTVSKKRKKKYKNNPEYREKAKKAALERRREKFREEELAREKAGPEEPEEKGRRGFPRPKVVFVKGAPVRLQSFGYLRAQCGLHKITLNRWLEQGILPKCVLIDRQKRRWYPESYVEFVVRVVAEKEAARQENGKWWFIDNFKKLVLAEWIKTQRQGLIPDLSKV